MNERGKGGKEKDEAEESYVNGHLTAQTRRDMNHYYYQLEIYWK